MSEYDSTIDTLLHIKRVNKALLTVCTLLQSRAMFHDTSKLMSPEKQVFDVVTPKLRDMTYGSDEYKASLAEMGEALKHHYEQNCHHPEHYENGISDMDLFDLVEMFCDWVSAVERHADGDIFKSIEHNKKRFQMSEQLCSILRNTARRVKL